MSEIQIPKTNKPNLPYLRDHADVDDDTLVQLQHFALLRPTQRLILKIIAESLMSDQVLTDAQIAEKAGIDRHTVAYTRRNANFLDCLREFMKLNARNDVPDILRAMKKSALKGSVKAQDLYIRYTGDFIPKSQIESKGQNLNANINLNSADAVGEFVALLCDKGWNVDRIHAEIDRAYLELKEQNRVI